MKYTDEDILEMFKALANTSRLQIMQWLSEPGSAFAGLHDHDGHGIPGWGGVCVGTIQEKAGLSQSATSAFLKVMLNAGLLESRRDGKWTYYRVCSEAVAALADYVEAWRR